MCSISILMCFEFLPHPFCYHYYIFYFYRNNSTVLCNVFASLICHLKELKIRKWMFLPCIPFLAFFISFSESKFLSGARFLVIFLLPKQLWHVWVCWQWIFWFCLSDSVFISHLFLEAGEETSVPAWQCGVGSCFLLCRGLSSPDVLTWQREGDQLSGYSE